jgi:ring-1,2-phenylacetyl-CoA epoxidase subunit PaaE
MPFVVVYAGMGLFRFVHIEHHRNVNEDLRTDPDAWAEAGPWFLLPLRWATIDLWYAWLWIHRKPRRPRAEVAETLVLLAATVATIVATALTGTLWTFAVVYLIPARIGLAVLAWWFDWLPHHGLEATQRQDRYRATRIRPGWEPFMTSLLLYQNYHLVHHLYPSVPFYRYIKTWRAGASEFLAHEPAITTAWGRDLTADEYRQWRSITGRLAPATAPRRAHPLTVTGVERLTDDAVAVTLAVPGDLADRFRFAAGQHVTVAAPDAGLAGRRTYSLAQRAPGADEVVTSLRIGVKQLAGGEFSTYAATRLRAGDHLEVAPPAGRFSPPVTPAATRRYVAVAAGSGITPILSVIATVLAEQPASRVDLLWGNRNEASILFAADVDELATAHPGRFTVHHVLSSVDGRIDGPRVLATPADPATVDHWLVCGPQALIEAVTAELGRAGIAPERIHRELFHVERDTPTATTRAGLEAVVSVTHAGGQLTFNLAGAGESILEAGLRELPDLPYSCMGGACGTCRARVVSGSVVMATDAALTTAEREAGYVLTCQAHPVTEDVTLTFDG